MKRSDFTQSSVDVPLRNYSLTHSTVIVMSVSFLSQSQPLPSTSWHQTRQCTHGAHA